MRYARLLSLIVLLGFFFGGCSKDDNNQGNNKPKNFRQLEESRSFDWRTNQDINLQVTGLETVNPITHTMFILNQEGEAVYKELRDMNKSGMINLTLPTYMTELSVKYGAIHDTVAIQSNGSASFSFIPEVQD